MSWFGFGGEKKEPEKKSFQSYSTTFENEDSNASFQQTNSGSSGGAFSLQVRVTTVSSSPFFGK